MANNRHRMYATAGRSVSWAAALCMWENIWASGAVQTHSIYI